MPLQGRQGGLLSRQMLHVGLAVEDCQIALCGTKTINLGARKFCIQFGTKADERYGKACSWQSQSWRLFSTV